MDLPKIEACKNMDELKEMNKGCKKCGLRQGCMGVVFGKGNPEADVLLIGEGPGAEEDKQGMPFVGAAGQLLDKIIAAAELPSEDVYIGNVVKCRPPGNRVPTDVEASTCLPWLHKQIKLVDPKLIVLLGSTAVKALIEPEARITKMRGQWLEIGRIKVMPTYHPAALLRDVSKKRPVWEDFKKIRDYYKLLKSN